jgi:tight adherence protein B
MHLLFQLLFAVMLAATVASLAADRAQRKRLLRLESLVSAENSEPLAVSPPAGQAFAAENLLPPTLVRGMHLAGLQPGPWNIVAVISGFAAAGLIAGLLIGPIAAAGIMAMLLLFAVVALNVLASRRAARLGLLIPGFLDRMRQLLVVGNSVPSAFSKSALGSQPALAKFFAPTLRRLHNGANFCDSIRQSADDLNFYEMHLFAAAIATNTRFGGSLTLALTNLVAYLRKRAAIDREIRSSTAQIRASAWVLGLLPMLVAGAIVLQNREYASWFLTHETGRKLLVYCLISQLMGALLMRAIVKTKF